MIAPRIAVILAGGQSRRMNGPDKAELQLGSRRLIDYAITRLQSQVDHILISGPKGYNTGLTHVPDFTDGPVGPAAGLWACLYYIRERWPNVSGFLTVPVDSPFFSIDLYASLSGSGCAIAASRGQWHPTMAYWSIDSLEEFFSKAETGKGYALKTVAKACSARPVTFADETALMNINTPKDWQAAQRLVSTYLDTPD